ncbi:MAG: 16S rRNA methyltransferase [Chloroflexi bacterium]|nr:MAG: 16S rRNA methyltransferase [Chloroflexota bacterium]
MERDDEQQVASLVDAVLASAKYRDISKELITRIAAQELRKRHNSKEALKATKNKLHQVGGAYLDTREHYTLWLNELKVVTLSGNRQRLLDLCATMMTHHASTRERIAILPQFYAQIFSELPPIRSVLDIACGLNPLALPWMQLAEEGAPYYAYDIYHSMVDFLQGWLALMHVQGSAQVCDVLQTSPPQQADVAFLLKAIPCLEQLDKTAGHRLLREIHAQNLVVSFPIHSLGGRSRGMLEHYETHFRELIAGVQHWEMKRLIFDSELVFVVKK